MPKENDVKILKGRIRMMGLKISNEEIVNSPLSDDQLTDLHENLKYLESQIKSLEAKGVEGCCSFPLDRNRTLIIVLKNRKAHLYVEDIQNLTISQMVTLKDMQRISRNDAYVLRIIQNPERYMKRAKKDQILDGFAKLETYVSSNSTRGSPVERDYSLDDDFEL